jgi:hypothetical protein
VDGCSDGVGNLHPDPDARYGYACKGMPLQHSGEMEVEESRVSRMECVLDCRDVQFLVLEALVSGTTFSEFVWNTRCLGEARRFALKAWLRQQAATDTLCGFEGTKEQLSVLLDYVQGGHMYP